jgi:purine-binding chemotaxis protein CheW
MTLPPTEGSQHLVIFSLEERQCALPLPAVERVVRAVEVTPLPEATGTVLGVINVQGQVVPVISLRPRFHLPEREIRPSDQFILVSASTRTLALVVDGVSGVVECPEQDLTPVESVFAGVECVEGVVNVGGALILVCSLERLLASEEEKTLATVPQP